MKPGWWIWIGTVWELPPVPASKVWELPPVPVPIPQHMAVWPLKEMGRSYFQSALEPDGIVHMFGSGLTHIVYGPVNCLLADQPFNKQYT